MSKYGEPWSLNADWKIETSTDTPESGIAAFHERPVKCVNALAGIEFEKPEDVRAVILAAREAIRRVNEQAEDDALWAEKIPLPSIAEAYIQQELRKLHGDVERIAEALSKLKIEDAT